MRCVICKTGETKPGFATVTLIHGETTVIIKKTPAEICETCEEYYLDADVADHVYRQADDAFARHAEVEIFHYAA